MTAIQFDDLPSCNRHVAYFDSPLRGGGDGSACWRCMNSAALCAAARQRGYSLSEENTPFGTPRERRGASPSTPDIAGLQPFKPQTANANFLWVGLREGYLFSKKRYPTLTPSQRKFPLQASSSKSCNACRLHFLRAAEPRWVLLNDLPLLLLSAAALPIL